MNGRYRVNLARLDAARRSLRTLVDESVVRDYTSPGTA
jgi:hypothetical protein